MFGLNRVRTPHGDNGQHLFNMLCFFLGATLLSISFGNVVSDASALLGGGFIVGGVGLAAGLLLTIVFRVLFGLVQTGRFLQYACFWAGTYAGVELADRLFAGFSSEHPIMLAFAVFALAFMLATWAGEVPIRGRTWLPKKKPR